MAIEKYLAAFRDAVVHGADSGFGRQLAIGVYQNNTRQLLLAVLVKHFPVCRRIIGEACFTQLALRYGDYARPYSRDLNLYGDRFAEFLSTQHQIVTTTPYLVDLCRIEFAVISSYYAADRHHFPHQRLKEVPPDQVEAIVLVKSPDIIGLALDCDADSLWLLHQAEHLPATIQCLAGARQIMVSRDQYKPHVKVVSETEYDLLCALDDKTSLGELAGVSGFTQELLQEFITKGWVHDFYVSA